MPARVPHSPPPQANSPTSPPATPPSKPLFQADTTQAFTSVRQSLAGLLSSLPPGILRPTALQKTLDIDYKLAWQIFNIVHAPDALAAANNIPGKGALKRFLTIAQRHGVPDDRIHSVQQAVDRFNAVVGAHASDRTAFDAMVSSLAPEDSAASLDLQHRRNAYRSESYLWGKQVDAHLFTGIVRPNAANTGTDECMLTARSGLRRLRPDAPCIVSHFRHHSSEDGVSNCAQQPLDPEAAALYHAPLLPQFSIQPMPALKTIPKHGGWNSVELAGDAIGKLSDVSLAFGGIARNVPFSHSADNRRILRLSCNFTTPCALYIANLLIHRPSYGRLEPQIMVFRESPNEHIDAVAREQQQLPVREKIIPLSVPDSPLPEFPFYPQMLHFACDRLGWNLAEFDAYRFRIAYPILNSCIRLAVNLPE